MLLSWYCTSVVYIMSESSYNLRPRVKVRSRSETRSALSHEPSSVTCSAVARSILTGEKGPVPGQHPVPEVVGSVVAPLPGPEMWSRRVFSIYSAVNSTVSLLEDPPVPTFLNVLTTGLAIYRMVLLLLLYTLTSARHKMSYSMINCS